MGARPSSSRLIHSRYVVVDRSAPQPKAGARGHGGTGARYPSTRRITSHERSIQRNGSKRPDPPRKQIDGCHDDSDSEPHRHPVRSGPFNREIDTEGQGDKPPATTLNPPAGKCNSKLSLIGVSYCAPKHDASPSVHTLWGECPGDSLTNAPLSLFQYAISRGRWHTGDPHPELESIHQRFAIHAMSITHNVRLACRSRGAGQRSRVIGDTQSRNNSHRIVESADPFLSRSPGLGRSPSVTNVTELRPP